MSSQFKIHFSRYSSRSGQRIRSRAQFIYSEGGIDGALKIANAILIGLKNDETHDYCVQSVEHIGFSGGDAWEQGASMFAEQPQPEEQA
jgi:hypothetical protein